MYGKKKEDILQYGGCIDPPYPDRLWNRMGRNFHLCSVVWQKQKDSYGSKNRDQVQASWLQQVIDELLYSRKKCGA
jgi:hypothetical protein